MFNTGNVNISMDIPSTSIEKMLRIQLEKDFPHLVVDKVYFNASKNYDFRGDDCGVVFSGVKVTFKNKE